MIEFILFAIILCVGSVALVAVPVVMHETLPRRRKWMLSIGMFLILVPAAVALYAWLGVPQMAVR